jgi:UDPglucose 6-dehydrogenase
MNIGMVGLGKLGMPVALAMDWKGHRVMGFDSDKAKMRKDGYPHRERDPFGEESIEPLLCESRLSFGSLADVVAHSEIVFVAVQTPHDPRYEGITRLPASRADFDYSYLGQAVIELDEVIQRQGKPKVVAIISTVLPGTLGGRILKLTGPLMLPVYNPSFIAMGTVMRDFLWPEFVLLGVKDDEAAWRVEGFYKTLTDAPIYKTSIENAELIKVAYNTFIGMKIVFANTLMELCHKLPGCDVDQVTDALKLARRRLISPAYLTGGMGDGGGCHPRDNIALSWLARKYDLSNDLFEMIMLARERQAEWLADLMCEHNLPQGKPWKMILGPQFKTGTDIMTGSAAVLVANILRERGERVKEFIEPPREWADEPMVVLIGAREERYKDVRFPKGSVVIDPWRLIPKQDGVTVIGVGRW